MLIKKEIIEEMERENTFKKCTSSRTNPVAAPIHTPLDKEKNYLFIFSTNNSGS